MATKVPEILEWTKLVAKGERHIENAEEFAFAAGQIVSYLIDCSEASHKTYSMLEPFLQKSTTNQIQDAIAGYISVYKHKIYVANFKFKNIAAEVLTDERNTAMKPLLKFFLAGCFCKCVIYNSAEKPQAEAEDNDSTE